MLLLCHLTNYILETQPIQVFDSGHPTGALWGQKDVPDVYVNGVNATGDGVPDGGAVPLWGKIRSPDDQAYSVCARNFKINGTPHTYEQVTATNTITPDGGWWENNVDCTSYQLEFTSGLPDGVDKVILIDDPE